MKLKELLDGIAVKNEYKDVDVLDVTQDSRLVREGSLFEENPLGQLGFGLSTKKFGRTGFTKNRRTLLEID